MPLGVMPLVIGLDFDNTLVRCRERVVELAAKNVGITEYPERHDYNFSDYGQLVWS